MSESLRTPADDGRQRHSSKDNLYMTDGMEDELTRQRSASASMHQLSRDDRASMGRARGASEMTQDIEDHIATTTTQSYPNPLTSGLPPHIC